MENILNFVFTLNSFTDEHVQYLEQYDCCYIVFGFEIAPTTGCQHLQGFVQLKSRRKFDAVRKELPWHIEPMKGKPEQARDYCKKDDKYFEKGTIRSSGGQKEQDRWKTVLEDALNGEWKNLMERDPGAYVHSFRNLHQIHQAHGEPHEMVRTCLWIFGKSGCGKTRYLRANFPNGYWKLANKWFDGYEHTRHDGIILDDFQKAHEVLGPHLLRWADRYPVGGEIKGGFIYLRHSYFVVSSNRHPREIFQDEDILAGIERRFKIHDMSDGLGPVIF